MADLPNVAVLGADEPLGEAVLELIGERGLAVGRLFPLALAEAEGCATVHGSAEPVQDVAGFDWSQATVLLSASRAPAVAAHEHAAARHGCRVAGFGADAGLPGKSVLAGALAGAAYQECLPRAALLQALRELDVQHNSAGAAAREGVLKQ